MSFDQTQILLGTYAKFYIGDFTATTPLVEIIDERTDGSKFIYQKPEVYVPGVSDYKQSGDCTIEGSFTFYGNSDDVIRLAMGNSISSPGVPDAPGGSTKYVLLVVDEDPTSLQSVLIPKIKTKRLNEIDRSKTDPSAKSIQFMMENRNEWVRLYHQRDLATLLALPCMNGRSPI